VGIFVERGIVACMDLNELKRRVDAAQKTFDNTNAVNTIQFLMPPLQEIVKVLEQVQGELKK
jgi:hypothetical protein